MHGLSTYLIILGLDNDFITQVEVGLLWQPHPFHESTSTTRHQQPSSCHFNTRQRSLPTESVTANQKLAWDEGQDVTGSELVGSKGQMQGVDKLDLLMDFPCKMAFSRCDCLVTECEGRLDLRSGQLRRIFNHHLLIHQRNREWQGCAVEFVERTTPILISNQVEPEHGIIQGTRLEQDMTSTFCLGVSKETVSDLRSCF